MLASARMASCKNDFLCTLQITWTIDMKTFHQMFSLFLSLSLIFFKFVYSLYMWPWLITAGVKILASWPEHPKWDEINFAYSIYNMCNTTSIATPFTWKPSIPSTGHPTLSIQFMWATTVTHLRSLHLSKFVTIINWPAAVHTVLNICWDVFNCNAAT